MAAHLSANEPHLLPAAGAQAKFVTQNLNHLRCVDRILAQMRLPDDDGEVSRGKPAKAAHFGEVGSYLSAIHHQTSSSDSEELRSLVRRERIKANLVREPPQRSRVHLIDTVRGADEDALEALNRPGLLRHILASH